MTVTRLLLSTAALLPLAAPRAALAQAGDLLADDQAIIVTAPQYAEGRTRSATKTDTPLNDVPQSVAVVTRDLIDDQALRSLADVVRIVPGVTIGQGEGHRDQITIRGNNTTADFFVDGVRDDVQYFRSFYNVERVEVLKGPNAMIFGRGGGGGVVNRVSKTPNPARGFNALAVSADSHGAVFAEGDANAPLTDAATLRINAFYEHLENHRDIFDGDRFGINPTLRIGLDPATDIVLSYEYADDERVVDRGIPSQAGRPVAGFRDSFFGVEGVNVSDFRAHIAKLTTRHDFSDAVSITNKLSYADYDKAYQNAFLATSVQTNGTVGVEAYRDPTQRRNLFSQTDFTWRVSTGSLAHVILIGNELGDQSTRNARINGFFDSGVPTTSSGRRTFVAFADPIAIPPISFRAGAGNRDVKTDADVLALYAQDQISLGAHIDVIAGIRYDRFRLAVADRLTGQRFARTDDLWSPRLGFVWKPVEAASLYASYSRSYLPQSGDQFLSLDPSLAALEPERFENYELGIKWDVLAALNVTAALYQLDRDNTRAAGPTPGTTVLTGAQRSKGIELGLNGEVMPGWRVSAGYALQDAEIRRTTTAAPAGRQVPQVPRHQLTLWNHVEVTPALGFGLGLYHQSRSFASISNAVVLPAYTRIDAAVYYKLSDHFELQANVENLTDETYFPTAHNDNNISTGGPIAGRLTLRARF